MPTKIPFRACTTRWPAKLVRNKYEIICPKRGISTTICQCNVFIVFVSVQLNCLHLSLSVSVHICTITLCGVGVRLLYVLTVAFRKMVKSESWLDKNDNKTHVPTRHSRICRFSASLNCTHMRVGARAHAYVVDTFRLYWRSMTFEVTESVGRTFEVANVTAPRQMLHFTKIDRKMVPNFHFLVERIGISQASVWSIDWQMQWVFTIPRIKWSTADRRRQMHAKVTKIAHTTGSQQQNKCTISNFRVSCLDIYVLISLFHYFRFAVAPFVNMIACPTSNIDEPKIRFMFSSSSVYSMSHLPFTFNASSPPPPSSSSGEHKNMCKKS